MFRKTRMMSIATTMSLSLSLSLSLSIALSIALWAGCGSDSNDDPDPIPTESIASDKANVRFKNARRLKNDFTRTLALDPAALCLELGQYDCVDEVHKITLLGVEPYGLGIDEPAKATGVTTPIVVERVALAGCTQRVALDLAAPADAVIFGNLPIDGQGRLSALDAAEVDNAIDTMYARAVQRHATGEEIEHLKDLYTEIEDTGVADPASDWAVATCFTVLTSLESLFY